MRQLLIWIADWLALLFSDWAHPEQKAERERIDAEAVTEDVAIDAHEAAQATLSKQAAEEDAAIVAGQEKLDEIVNRKIDVPVGSGLRDKL